MPANCTAAWHAELWAMPQRHARLGPNRYYRARNSGALRDSTIPVASDRFQGGRVVGPGFRDLARTGAPLRPGLLGGATRRPAVKRRVVGQPCAIGLAIQQDARATGQPWLKGRTTMRPGGFSLATGDPLPEFEDLRVSIRAAWGRGRRGSSSGMERSIRPSAEWAGR